MGRGPAAVLVDGPNGVELAAQNGVSIPANTTGILILGSDSGTARFLRISSDGTLRIDPTGTTAQPITDGGGSLTIDNANIDAALSTLATESTLEAARALLQAIDADTSNLDVALSTRATESTLNSVRDNIGEAVGSPAANSLLARLQTVIDRLTSIKDTDGVQIIDDIIRLGDTARNGINSILNNTIRRLETRSSITSANGSLDVGVVTNNSINRLEGRSSITSPNGSLDVGVVTDNSINRFESRNTIVGQIAATGSEVKVTTIANTQSPSTEKRLQTESRLAPGSTVNIGTGIPADPSDLDIAFLRNGGSENMRVNGSGTPVAFTYGPTAGVVLSVQEILVVFTADDFDFDGLSFGPNSALTNGIQLQTDINSVVTEIFNIKQNEDFLRVPGRIPLVNNTGPKDVLGVSFVFGGLVKLVGDDGDQIIINIRDNLTNVKLKYLTGTIYSTKD